MGKQSGKHWAIKGQAALIYLAGNAPEAQKREFLRQFRRPGKLFPGGVVPERYRHLLA